MKTAAVADRFHAGSTRPDVEPVYNDPETASAWLSLSEIDLDKDGMCDLVALVAPPLNGRLETYLVYWFSGQGQWRRQGPTVVAGRLPRGNAVAAALSEPQGRDELEQYGFSGFVPVIDRTGRMLLLTHEHWVPGRDTPAAHLISYDPSARQMRRLPDDAATLQEFEALVTRVCEKEQSKSPACMSQ